MRRDDKNALRTTQTFDRAGMIEMVCVTPPHQGKRYGRDKYPVRQMSGK
jgi:hypothetical protein